MPHDDPLLSIGALAKRTGLSVRTLHHYDAIGLLCPAQRTAAGHRRYNAANVTRLQLIVSLRAVGLPLNVIGALLDDPEYDPLSAVEQHLAQLHGRIAREQALCERLEGIITFTRSGNVISTEALLDAIHLTTMIEQHYTPEQLEALKQRKAEVGEARIQEVQQEWQDLFTAFDRHREAGTDPAAPEVQELARKAEALIAAFTGGDAGIRQSLETAAQEQPAEMRRMWGITPELGDYYGRAMAALAR